ncbi:MULTISPECIES: ABC transporter permease [unclassified Streptococcus]|uniref:ABC transporter permease n=1 Tax=unclassified Streptococcus TaxID=2608887 RepID=UPI0010723FE6|nr:MULTISPECIES: ABC transporter permease [unclassified Streptococcus]MBF0786588.1 ABC transporter permease [Streptococcus sp. 19428wC2_LYSM12]MCQ9210919.1 ABC transporter permease [Streptococcus sp. B01]MCQ9214188.1 ABC transporter permease [Streptococcus sp. O1]TFV06551.1 ABC transporter permease [Streptococcus sp. LYSM12]
MDILSKKNRILLKELIKTDFKLRYQGSVIGYLWSILKPLMMFAIMYVVFVRFLRLGGDVPHFPVALLLANVIWSFFSEATNMGMVSIISRGDLLRKLSFSKHIIVLSAICGAMINFGINLVVVLIFALINGVSISWSAIFAPLLFLELFLLAFGVALLLSTLFVKFRDLGQIWEVMMQAGMYATPIIYPITFVSNQSITAAKVMMLSPLAQIIQDLRYLLIDKANVTIWQMSNHWWYIVIPYLIPAVVFAFGLTIFNRSAKRFAEII